MADYLKPNDRPDWSRNKKRVDVFEPLGQQKAAKITLPDGRRIGGWNKITGADVLDQLTRGGTYHIPSSMVPLINQLNWLYSKYLAAANLPSSYTTVKDATSGTMNFEQPDMARAAQVIAPAGLYIDELGEGQFATFPDAPQRQWFLAELKQVISRYNEQAKREGLPLLPWNNLGQYGSFGIWQPRRPDYSFGGPILPTDERMLKALRTVEGAQSMSQTYLNNDFKLGVGPNIKNYVDVPKYANVYWLMMICARSITKAIGMNGGLGGPDGMPVAYIDWNNKEGLNYPFGMGHCGRVVEGGMIYNQDNSSHMKVDPEHLLGCEYMIGLTVMKMIIGFDVPNTYSPNRGNVSTTQRVIGNPKNLDIKQVAAETYGQGYFEEPEMGHDSRHIAGELYKQTEKTEGKPWLDLDYRFEDSDQWFGVQPDDTEPAFRANALGNGSFTWMGRPDVRGRETATNYDIAEFDPCSPKWKERGLVVKFPSGRQVKIKSKGGTLRTYSGSF